MRSAARYRAALRSGFDREQCKRGDHDLSFRIRWSTAKDDGKIAPELARAESSWEVAMAKGQLRSNKEAKKPKAEKAKAHASAYKLSQVKGPQSVIVPPAKKS
jgi:hypothetical protein